MALIDRDELFKERMPIHEGDHAALLREVLKRIQNARVVDAVEVVRCKDCKHWEARCNGKAGICPKRKGVARADDFCSYGERREEDAAD